MNFEMPNSKNPSLREGTASSEFAVENPYTGEHIDSVRLTPLAEVEDACATAGAASRLLKRLSRFDRADVLHQVADDIELDKGAFAELIVAETGKTIAQATKEVNRCINTLTLCAEEAKRSRGELIAFDSVKSPDVRQGYYTTEPVGLVAAITPYNDPLNLAAHKVGPAIAAGAPMLLKPSELAPLTAARLMKAVHKTGYEKRTMSIVNGRADVGRVMTRHASVRMVSFTGGVATGEAIVREAGLKKFSMDLGGNAPVIVLSDADISGAVIACTSGAFWAAGQNCIGTQRILVERKVYAAFRREFVDQVLALQVGDPMNPICDVGPMITEGHAIAAEDRVTMAIEQGAELLAGHSRRGAVYMPTVLENVSEASSVWCEEAFAPVVTLVPFDTFEEAITMANQPNTMLHAGIFTSNLESALIAADRLEASGVMINDSSDFRLDAMPFGGFKYGSMGREGVEFAIGEMTQTKVVCFNRPAH